MVEDSDEVGRNIESDEKLKWEYEKAGDNDGDHISNDGTKNVIVRRKVKICLIHGDEWWEWFGFVWSTKHIHEFWEP